MALASSFSDFFQARSSRNNPMVPNVSASSGRKNAVERRLSSTRGRRSVTEGSEAYSGRMFWMSAWSVLLIVPRIACG